MKYNDLNIIKRSALFTDLTEEELQDALRALHIRQKQYQKDELLLMAGDVTNDLGLILSGSATIESNDVWGNRTIIGLIAAGEYYAEVFAIMPEEPSYVDVRTNEQTTVALFDMSRLQGLKNTAPSWLIKLLGNLVFISIHKNMILSQRSFHTSPKSARGRVCAYLNSIAMKTHRTEFDIPFDRQHMADYLNLDRTALSKELCRMREDGLITFRKNHFKILNPEGFDSIP